MTTTITSPRADTRSDPDPHQHLLRLGPEPATKVAAALTGVLLFLVLGLLLGLGLLVAYGG